MESSEKPYKKDLLGNIRFEFFTILGSLTIEAWRNTRMCRVSTYSKGVGRRTEVRLDDDMWWKLINPVAYSGFWIWHKRYDLHAQSGYMPSWSISIMTECGWYYSSGDGSYPEGFLRMLDGLTRFASEIEGSRSDPVCGFLSPFLNEGEA